MKNRFSKLISAMLILAFLISAFSIFTFAEEGDGEEEVYDVFLNRTFDEGWNYTNGMSVATDTSSDKFTIDYEEDETYRYNYFLRLLAESTSANSVYFEFPSADRAKQGKTVVEFSIKADDVATLGKITYITTSVYKMEIPLFEINAKGHLIAFPTMVESNTAQKDNTVCHPELTNGYCSTCHYCNHGSRQTATSGNCNYTTCLGCGANFAIDLGVLGNEWIDIALVFDWGKLTDGKDFDCQLLWGEDYENSINVGFEYEKADDKGITNIHFGFPQQKDGPVSNRLGMSYCIDNLKIYQGTSLKGLKDIDPNNYGKKVDPNEVKTINIQQGAGFKSKAELLEESLCMKLGVDYALLKNARRPIYDGTYGAPVKDENGNVMVSLDLLLEYIGYPYYRHPDMESYDITTGISATYITANRKSATVAGERIELTVAPTYYQNKAGTEKYLTVAVSDIEALFPGFLTVYDEMGLVIVYEDITPEDLEDNGDIVTRDEDLEVMVGLMQKFLFETVNGETAEDTYLKTADKIIKDAKKNTSLTHPYLITNGETFDKLAGIYNGQASVEKAYLEKIVNEVEAFYNSVAITVGDNYYGIKDGKTPVNPYTDGLLPEANNPDDKTAVDTKDGYNSKTGRLVEAGEFAEKLVKLAFAYQVTGKDKYALLAYDFASALAGWEHWGPGNFVDCATATSNFAIAYDWLYNAYKELNKNTDVLAKAIYEKGIHDGYVSSTGEVCEHPREIGDNSHYATATDNVNVIGTSGMVIGILATIDYVEADQTMLKEATYVLGNNVVNLIDNGLMEFAPDGAYIESATYWELASTAFFKMVMALDSATGDDFGFIDTWGIDKTCYYAAHIESSDGFIWNYNDAKGDGFSSGDIASLDTAMFTFAGMYLGDKTIVAFRLKQLESGKKDVSIYDMLFYPFDGVSASGDLPLDYHMDGLEGFVSRSDWNDGALYTGIMGGSNSGSHAQADSGNFIYYNKGIVWFMDLGSENENIADYSGANRYKYYRASAEGQNVVVLSSDATSSLKAGQHTSFGGNIIKHYANEAGSYAIIDNLSVYGGLANMAFRGLFVTNDRQTVVIQDEMAFKQFETVYWVAHTAQSIYVDESGQVAYLSGTDAEGNEYMLRATLVSLYDFSFSVIDGEKTAIFEKNTKINNNLGEDETTEYARKGLQRLVIKSEQRISFNCAVVLEMVDGFDSKIPVGYKWTYMDEWMPYSADEFDPNDTEKLRDDLKLDDVITYAEEAQKILSNRDKVKVYTVMLDDLYEALTRVGYTWAMFEADSDEFSSEIFEAYDSYKSSLKSYNKYLSYVEDICSTKTNIAQKLVGIEVPTAED